MKRRAPPAAAAELLLLSCAGGRSTLLSPPDASFPVDFAEIDRFTGACRVMRCESDDPVHATLPRKAAGLAAGRAVSWSEEAPMAVHLSKGKVAGISACADKNGVIAAAAMDQRGSLEKSIAKARGAAVSPADMTAFKAAVTGVLTRHASAILLDPEYGLPALPARAPGTGVLLAYEKTGYDTKDDSRFPDLLPEWSVRRLVEAGAHAVKLLLYWNPTHPDRVNEPKHAFVERLGAECTAADVPLFLEVVAYDDSLGDPKGIEFARAKPRYVKAYMEEFSRPRYGVDVLKVEVPVTMSFVEGTPTFSGQKAYSRAEAMAMFRDAASVARVPFIYLSAGVSDATFLATLELAAEAGTPFSGVLCGRATWQDGIPVFATKGRDALVQWLEDRGVANVKALNAALAKGAKPWWDFYGGKGAITTN